MKKRKALAQYHLHREHPEKLQFELYDLQAYRKRSGDLAATPHSHSYYQIIWFFESGGTHTVDFKTVEILANTIVLVDKDQIHAFDENLEVKGWLLHFNEAFFMHSDVDIFLKYAIFNTLKNPFYRIGPDFAEMSMNYIAMIREELEGRGRFGFEEVVRYLLKAFLINLERLHRETNTDTLQIGNTYAVQYYRFKEHVEHNYRKHCMVEAYAKALNISSKTLATITKTIAGKTPSQLISERVVLEARRLLRFSTLQVSEVAFQLGFEDDSYFNRFFKRHMGLSPNAYRKL